MTKNEKEIGQYFRVDLDVKTWNVQAACKGSGLFERGRFILAVFCKVLWSGIVLCIFSLRWCIRRTVRWGRLRVSANVLHRRLISSPSFCFEGKWYSIQVMCSAVPDVKISKVRWWSGTETPLAFCFFFTHHVHTASSKSVVTVVVVVVNFGRDHVRQDATQEA